MQACKDYEQRIISILFSSWAKPNNKLRAQIYSKSLAILTPIRLLLMLIYSKDLANFSADIMSLFSNIINQNHASVLANFWPLAKCI